MAENDSQISKEFLNQQVLKAPPSERFGEAALLRVLYFFAFACQAAWLPIFADYLGGKGYTGFRLGFILSITPAMMFLVQPVYGYIADKAGYKKTLLIASALAAVSFLGYILQGGFFYMAGVTVLMSLFFNTIQPVLDSLALQLTNKNPSFSYGSLRIAGAAGWSVMGIVTGYLIDNISTQVIFIISAVAMTVTFLFALALSSYTKNAAEEKTDAPAYKQITSLLNNPQLLKILIATVFISIAATTIWNFYSIYMKENGATAKIVGYGLALQGLCELPLFYFSAKIINYFGLKKTLLITLLATALRMWLYSIVKNPQWALCIEMLHGISWSLFWVVCVDFVNKLVKDEWKATGQSILYAAYFGIGAIAGNFWTSYLYDCKMKIADIFLLNAGIILITGVVVWIFIKEKKIS
jgi:MFS transporter, PPP family, 3-phenylpropionic acid transporter